MKETIRTVAACISAVTGLITLFILLFWRH